MHIQRFLLSLAIMVFAGAVVVGGTGAFFSDEETSTGNVFAAGSLDLKVDSEAHYNGLICSEVGTDMYEWKADGVTFQTDADVPADHYPQPGMECDGTWEETDLGAQHQFFNLNDVKPGDEGENTLSLHVTDNDAWGRMVISNVEDRDVNCTEPETEVGALDPECDGQEAGYVPDPDNNGELAENISITGWIDQGATPGFQCGRPDTNDPGAGCDADPTEGDNIQQCEDSNDPTNCNEPTVLMGDGAIDPNGETHNIWEGLAAYRAVLDAQHVCDNTDSNGDGHTVYDDTTPYGVCHGLARDGRMVGSTTYYFGLGWSIPDTVGNEAQSDSIKADVGFEVVQHRNNETKQF